MAMGPYDTVVAVWNGTLYNDLQSRKRALMSQGAEIQAAKMRAQSAGDTEGIQWANEAFQRNQSAKNALQEAGKAYDTIAEAIATYTYSQVDPPRMGLGALPAIAAIPASVQAILLIAGVAAAIVTFWKYMSLFDTAISNAANIIEKIGGTVEKSADAFTKIAMVAGVGFLAYLGMEALKKRGAI